jgi:hypothetical protein
MQGKGGAYAAGALLLLTVAYGLFQARTLIQGPVLVVTYPTPGETVLGQTYVIRGNAQNISRVSINGRAVTTNLKGDFDETMVTPDGLGILLVEAENRLGRYESVRIEFYGKPDEEM